MAASAGTNVCLRQVRADRIWAAFREEKVTHYCGAPVVHNLILDSREALDHQVSAMVAGAPPPAAMIEGMAGIGIDLTHAYGLTETYGPATFAAPQDGEWNAAQRGRQGVRYLLEDSMTVVDDQGAEVPRDGETMGEIVFRGNIVMKGYLKNEEATEEAFRDGWFHSGDLAVRQEDGYVKIKDRAKDVIISGGENISSVEVEDALYRHPAVMFAGVVARPDEKWGETPIAYVQLKPEKQASEQELLEHCRQYLAKFKVPREIRFQEIPRTSTGKIQKNVLREQANSAGAID
jgi:3-(methylthio)propionyl---CoA ligase